MRDRMPGEVTAADGRQTSIIMLPGPNAENPYVRDLAKHLHRRVRPFGFRSALGAELAVIHWPQKYAQSWVRVATFGLLLLWIRMRGRPLIWVVHNLEPHSGLLRHRLAYWMALQAATQLVSLSGSTVARIPRAMEYQRRGRLAIIPHSGYARSFHGDKDAARGRLDLPAEGRIFVLFGSMRRNKMVIESLDWFRAGAAADDLLVLAGRATDPGVHRAIDHAQRADARIRFMDGFLPEVELSCLITAADACLAFFDARVANSGTVVYALSHARPVIGTEVGAVAEMRALAPSWMLLSAPGAFPQFERVRSFLEEERAPPPHFPPSERVAEEFDRVIEAALGFPR